MQGGHQPRTLLRRNLRIEDSTADKLIDHVNVFQGTKDYKNIKFGFQAECLEKKYMKVPHTIVQNRCCTDILYMFLALYLRRGTILNILINKLYNTKYRQLTDGYVRTAQDRKDILKKWLQKNIFRDDSLMCPLFITDIELNWSDTDKKNTTLTFLKHLGLDPNLNRMTTKYCKTVVKNNVKEYCDCDIEGSTVFPGTSSIFCNLEGQCECKKFYSGEKCNTHPPKCTLKIQEDFQNSTKLTSETTTHITVWGSSSCTLRILAVGGGGGGGIGYGGGRSGFHKYYTAKVPIGDMTITAKVGSGGKFNRKGGSSIVVLPDTTLTALGGNCPTRRSVGGGSGYSGGGSGWSGTGGYKGGSNGGKGGGSKGGAGNGVNISEYSFNNFTLSPGEGGQFHNVYRLTSTGGGGGGLMVNSTGPYAKTTVYYNRKSYSVQRKGSGYGGGGSGQVSGLPGVILIEVVTLPVPIYSSSSNAINIGKKNYQLHGLSTSTRHASLQLPLAFLAPLRKVLQRSRLFNSWNIFRQKSLRLLLLPVGGDTSTKGKVRFEAIAQDVLRFDSEDLIKIVVKIPHFHADQRGNVVSSSEPFRVN